MGKNQGRECFGNLRKKGGLLNKIAAGLCAAALLVIPSDGAFNKTAAGSSAIDDLQQEIEKIRQENEQRQAKIDKYSGDISENEEAMDLVSEQIDGVNAEIMANGELLIAEQGKIDDKQREIEGVEKDIADREQEIENKKREIEALEAENKRNLEKFAKLARALYMNDSSGTLPILNGSDDWYNYFVYSDVVKNISGQNVMFMEKLLADIKNQERMIDDLNDEIALLEKEKQKLEDDKKKLEQEKQKLEDDKEELERYASQRKEYLNELTAENYDLNSKVAALEYDKQVSLDKLDELDRTLRRLIREAQANGDGTAYTDGFRWPLDPNFKYITTYFGYDPWRGSMHRGIDVGNAGIAGANIYAAQSGTVILVSNTCPHNYGKYYSCGCGGGFGNYVVVDHGGGLATLYAHCQAIYVSTGDFVYKGDTIAAVGTTGWSTGYHLHFEVREDGDRVDPFGYSYSDY